MVQVGFLQKNTWAVFSEIFFILSYGYFRNK